ncbi:MAG: hypothetical protein PHT24_07600 [Endomicrobiaceae bacterium]|nr:hypothetical protein [Endomicrobiaceae bacterium]
MHDFARGVIGAFGFAVFHFQQVFKNLAQHFRVNGNFLFQRLVFFDGEIITIKNIQNTVANIALLCRTVVGKQFVGKHYGSVHPVIIIDRVKKSTV